MDNAEMTKAVELSNGSSKYEFTKSDGKIAYVLWNTTADVTEKVSLATGRKWDVCDVFGNCEPIELNTNGEYSINVGSVPVYIAEHEDEPIAEPEKLSVNIYKTDSQSGDVSVKINGLSEDERSTILVLKPGKDIDDIYSDTINALAYIGQVPLGESIYDFTFTAVADGTYKIYVESGEKFVNTDTTIDRPDVSVVITQNGYKITEMSEIDPAKEITITAASDNAERKMTLLCAAYSDYALRNIESDTNTTEGDTECSVTLSTGNDFKKLKIFVWQNSSTLVPIIGKIEW